jgi:hypothetical protein
MKFLNDQYIYLKLVYFLILLSVNSWYKFDSLWYITHNIKPY